MKKSFTLIEVIVAIGIFGIGVLALLGYFAFSTQFVRYSRQTSIATNLAQEVIEETLAQPYDSLLPDIGQIMAFPDPYNSYQKRLNISLIDSSLGPSATDIGLKKIEVLVYWTGMGGEKNVQMATVVSKK